MESYRQINILLIGLTGVGKSSFINSFANYLTYQSIQEAIKADKPICLVPTYFEYTDSSIKAYPVRISANDDENEDFTCASNSSTQSPKIYTFRFKSENLEINIMDSPGAADTRGFTMDKQNIQTILDAVSTFSQLHLICLLLKSTEPRLTPEFQFGLNELLMHLHKNAVSNLVFVITNSRASNYSLGHVSAPLKDYLKKLKKSSNIKIELNQSNVFCIDNEAYRLQCLWNQYPKLKDPSQMATVEGSWKTSFTAIKALIKRGLEINAHDVAETVSLNEARSAILLLNDPLTKIYVILQTCVKNYDKNQDAISVGIINNAHRDLDIKVRKIKAPKTICTKCSLTCHQNCKLRGIRIKSQVDEKLRDCASFDRETGICFKCGCHYKLHMRELYETEKTYRNQNFVDTVDGGSETTQKNIHEKLDQVIEELSKEKKMIEEALEKFGTFLRNNAILEYNYVLENRLELEIKLAEGNGDYKVATLTKEMLEKYKTQKEQLIDAIKSGKKQKEIITSQSIVTEIREKLFEMKFYGKKIEELYEIQLKLSQADIIETDRIEYDAIIPITL
uniref:G domain-containing protein n=1 Tax=Panagrolaimus superbus TaxID=310955 RepID=A0A914XTK2_9BILA